MAEKPTQKAPAKPAENTAELLDFVGMDKVVAVSADAFLVARGEDVLTILFFQNQIPEIKRATLGTGGQLDAQETKCIARITLSPSGFRKLLTSMAETSGFSLTTRTEEKQ